MMDLLNTCQSKNFTMFIIQVRADQVKLCKPVQYFKLVRFCQNVKVEKWRLEKQWAQNVTFEIYTIMFITAISLAYEFYRHS